MNEPTPTTPPPAAVETTPAPAPSGDPVKTNLLAQILGLVKPDEKDVKPPVTDEDEEGPTKQKVVERIRTTAPVVETPAEPKPADAAAAAVEPKKVTVKKKEPLTKIIAEEVRKATETRPVAPVAPVPAPAPVVTAVTTPEVDDDLTPEEREELDLAAYAEKSDPTKKGLSDKFRRFYKAQKEFIEKAAAKSVEDGEDYDPTEDPNYKKFLAANEPKFTAAERKKLFQTKIMSEAREAAVKEAEEKIAPQISELQRKTLELERRPAIKNRVASYIDEVAEGMPEDVVKFYNDNGQDVAKTEKEFPLEFGVIRQSMAGAQALANTFLSVKEGLEPFRPEQDPKHKYLADFVTRQGDIFARSGGSYLNRNGKTFVHPGQWKPGMESTNWTFDNEDVLRMLKVEVQKEVRGRISAEEKRLESLGFSRVKKAPAPVGAAPVAAAAATKKEVEASPRTPSTPLPGAATNPPAASNALLNMLGLK